MPIKRARGRKKEETEARLPVPIDRLACSLARSSLCLEGSGIMGRINMQGYATYVRILRMGAKGLLLGELSRAEPSKTRPNAEGCPFAYRLERVQRVPARRPDTHLSND